jgi:hypothetical protein
MIKFFRKIRQDMIKENRVSKYLLYAIGEIALVMIGILLALQVNNWNEGRKQDAQLDQYRANLVSELHDDLEHLDELDSVIIFNEGKINRYLELYNDESLALEQVAASMDSATFKVNNFISQTYTLTELINSGNISLFSPEEKKGLTKLRNELDRRAFQERETLEVLMASYRDYSETTDMLFQREYSKTELPSVKDWRTDKGSIQFKSFHNNLAYGLELYEYQRIHAYAAIRDEIHKALAILEGNR